MLAAIPDARGVEIEANHYTIMLGDAPGVAEAVRAFLGDGTKDGERTAKDAKDAKDAERTED